MCLDKYIYHCRSWIIILYNIHKKSNDFKVLLKQLHFYLEVEIYTRLIRVLLQWNNDTSLPYTEIGALLSENLFCGYYLFIGSYDFNLFWKEIHNLCNQKSCLLAFIELNTWQFVEFRPHNSTIIIWSILVQKITTRFKYIMKAKILLNCIKEWM